MGRILGKFDHETTNMNDASRCILSSDQCITALWATHHSLLMPTCGSLLQGHYFYVTTNSYAFTALVPPVSNTVHKQLLPKSSHTGLRTCSACCQVNNAKLALPYEVLPGPTSCLSLPPSPPSYTYLSTSPSTPPQLPTATHLTHSTPRRSASSGPTAISTYDSQL